MGFAAENEQKMRRRQVPATEPPALGLFPRRRRCRQLTVWRLPAPEDLAPGPRSEAASPSVAEQALPAPIAASPVPGGEPQRCVRFNPGDALELVTNGKRRAYFWRVPEASAAGATAAPAGDTEPPLATVWAGDASAGTGPPTVLPMAYYSPPLIAADFRQPVGHFLASVFVPGSRQVCVRTCASRKKNNNCWPCDKGSAGVGSRGGQQEWAGGVGRRNGQQEWAAASLRLSTAGVGADPGSC
jgi:hypothetical protein